MTDLINNIATKTWMDPIVIDNIIKLLDDWNTVPFIARYRKELTKWATDWQLRDFNDIYVYTKNLEKRKEAVIRLIDEKWLLTDELRKKILDADSLVRVEDLYRPFKEKKNSKATIAKARWLEPLAILLRKASLTKQQFEIKAQEYIKDTGKPETSVNSVEEAIQWAKDIIAEDVSDSADLRDYIKRIEQDQWYINTKPTKTFETDWVYRIYWNYQKRISQIPSYAYLAICRAEYEKQISVKFIMWEEIIYEKAEKSFVPRNANTSSCYLIEAVHDWLKRLLLPSIEREIRSDKKQWADIEAIKVFGENMKNLLLIPPIKGLTVLWFDPAFRTGCKLAVVDKTGKFLYNSVIYPTEPQKKIYDAEIELLKIIKDYNVDLITIWNGTASRESEMFIVNFLKKNWLKIQYMIVNEAGASVYSASKLAQQEYPNLDVTVRWAISIAHRVQDPLAELTKIDPKSIWVWQYQHDVDQKLLKEKLDEKVEDVVNSVWVDVNTASYTLLWYVAGLSMTMSQNIVSYRDLNWEFKSKSELKWIKWIWPKAYEQAVGFLRIKQGNEPLDVTGIHPETYKKTYEILDNEFWMKKTDVKLPMKINIDKYRIQEFAKKYEIWYDTLNDIFRELQRPWLDPRDEIEKPIFKSDVMNIDDLEEGMVLEWVVRNVTDFGAFVDIGLHNDGLVHISQLANHFVRNPSEIVSVGQNIKVKVIGIDKEKEKVSLSMKDC